MVSVCIFLLSFAFSAFIEENHVIVLDDSSMPEALITIPQLLVEFYAPWCQFCQSFAPMYSKAGQRLALEDPPIKIAKIDATANLESSLKYNIDGYPTLLFFVNGEPTEYRGLRTENGVVSWLIKKISPPAKLIDSKVRFEKYLESNPISVILFSNKPEVKNVFEKVAKNTEGNFFALVEDSEVIEEVGMKDPALAVFNSNPLKKSVFAGNFIENEISKFIETSVMPWLMPYNEKVTQMVFGKQNPCLFVFVSEDDTIFHLDTLQNIANYAKGSILITYTDLNSASNKRLTEFLGFPSSWMPFSIIIDSKGQKFVQKLPISEENLLNFINTFKKGALKPYYKSQSLPTTEYEENVRVLVGENFSKIALDKTSDVLVLFYAPWCGHCKKLMPEYENLAKNYAGKNLVIAKIDATENEGEEFDIQSFPTVKIYPVNNKSGIEFKGKKDLESLEKFLKENASLPFKKLEL